MKKLFLLVAMLGLFTASFAQRMNVLDEVKANPQKSYGTDYG